MRTDRDDALCILGNRYWNPHDPHVEITREDFRHHVYVVGKSGTGKTTLLSGVLMQRIARGDGVALLDPHGDLAESILDHIPRWRINDVVHFSPSDEAYPVAFNLFQTVPRTDRNFTAEKTLIVCGLLSVFRKTWAEFWGPRTEDVTANALLALVEAPGTTLLSFPRSVRNDLERGA